MTLRFSTDLPPGAKVAGEPDSRGVDREEVRRQLRGNPGQWALVYGGDEQPEGASVTTAHSWRKESGFQVATQIIEDSKTDADGNKLDRQKWRYKIWIKYDPQGQEVAEQVAPESPASPQPEVTQPVLPTPPAPVSSERPLSAFEKEWASQASGPPPAPTSFE